MKTLFFPFFACKEEISEKEINKFFINVIYIVTLMRFLWELLSP